MASFIPTVVLYLNDDNESDPFFDKYSCFDAETFRDANETLKFLEHTDYVASVLTDVQTQSKHESDSFAET